MQLSKREELNCLYMDDIRYALKNGIANYKRVEFAEPVADIELENDKVVMLDKEHYMTVMLYLYMMIK